MSIVDQAMVNQLKNIQTRTGKTMDELLALIRQSGLAKHAEIRDMLKNSLGLGHGDAHMLTLHYLKTITEKSPHPGEDPIQVALEEIYSGSKAALRPLHERIMESIQTFGEFEISPKKGYLSLRRKRQFAMIGPASKGRIEVGLNMKDVDATDRLLALPPGGMCQFKVFISSEAEVDNELTGWIKLAYERTG